ncbi:Zinc finger protein 37 [Eumeta japonica]|uniref:Zinc finger protein 37 n=1 Tax=Eumeta variegata TaxID=151549 RepID=A0A4C1ZU94_EUMVA|nr:Zinc finger protein 37 [Eumeta japonica]
MIRIRVVDVINRLRAALIATSSTRLTCVKSSSSPPPAPATAPISTSVPVSASASVFAPTSVLTPVPDTIPLKSEPTADCIKEEPPDSESPLRLDCDDPPPDALSDDSDISLLTLKQHKKSVNVLCDSDFRPTNGVRAVSADRKRKRRNGQAGPPPPPVSSPYYCCTCFARYDTQEEMLHHYKEHARDAVRDVPPPTPLPLPPQPADAEGGARPTCPRCGQMFVRVTTLEKHLRAHTMRDRRPYRCSLCEKTFKEAREIMKHSQKHRWRAPEEGTGQVERAGAADAADKRFVCDLCPERFVYMRYLVAHRRTAHPDAVGPMVHRCVQCVRDFAHLNSLRRHLRSHNGERNFLCNVCGKALTSREHLKYHIRIHTGHKPHVCRTCNKGFVKKCNLTLHERVHSGEKPHVCSHCGKAFSQRSTLVIHERYHSGARPYVCPHCGRGFVARGLLSVHLKTTCV